MIKPLDDQGGNEGKRCGHEYGGKSYCLAHCEECVAYAIAGLLKARQASARQAAADWVEQEKKRNSERGNRIAERAKEIWGSHGR